MAKGFWKESVTTFVATALIVMALIVGFLGGVVYSDRAYRKLGIQGMDSQDQASSDQMPPASMNGQLPEGHPPIDNSNGQLPAGHPDVSAMGQGQTAASQADTQKQIDQMEESLKQDPKNVDLWVHLGNLYFDANQTDKAINHYETALKLKPDMPSVWTDCGVMYRQIGNYAKAIEYFNNALKYSPNFAQSFFNLGVVYDLDLKDYPKAIEAWNKFLQLNPTFENANEIRQQIAQMETIVKTGKSTLSANPPNTMDQLDPSSHADPVLVQGKAVYDRMGCRLCHSMNGIGGKTAPDLTHVSVKRSENYIRKVLTEPKSVAPNSNMPPIKLPQKDFDALVKYLQTLK